MVPNRHGSMTKARLTRCFCTRLSTWQPLSLRWSRRHTSKSCLTAIENSRTKMARMNKTTYASLLPRQRSGND